MEDKIIKVLPQGVFDQEMEDRMLDDTNVEGLTDEAFISIIGTEECLVHYLDEPYTEHWFKTDHTNVLNLEFDDVDHDIEYKGHLFKAISKEQAEKTVNFIEANLGKNFTIHCRAGKSRSQAIGKFIFGAYKEHFAKEQPYLEFYFANAGVLRALNRVLMERAYEEEKLTEQNKK